MKRGEVITVLLATVIAAVFVKTGAARLPGNPVNLSPFPSIGTTPDSAAGSAVTPDSGPVDTLSASLGRAVDSVAATTPAAATLVAPADTANLYRHPPVLVYSERMLAPLLVRASKPEARPFTRTSEVIERELARARDRIFLKEYNNLAHLPKSIDRARKLVENARAGKKVPVSLTRYCLQGTTRRDHYVREGIVAADPKLFKLGHYVEVFLGDTYLGRFLVDDTGGNVKGATLDIWTPSCSEARRFGRQPGAAMLVAKPESTH